ncbi:hypothetical protein BC830DRAFT_1111694 [Chytriomyces sp. MP71]|nr:hypothetical protein BC830DRAFT_1111694 [Chytriomyces sp. MP71]
MTKTTHVAPKGSVYYFTYGSNMARATMLRRSFSPTETVVCSLPGYQISFHLKGYPYIEPAFATVFPRTVEAAEKGNPRDAVGVVHLITDEEFNRIVHTEGGMGHKGWVYEVETVVVVAMDGQKYEAKVLSTPMDKVDEEYWPSRRYVDLCVAGATEQGLPENYIAWMKALPCYDPAKKTLLQKAGSLVFRVIFMPVMFACFIPAMFLAKRNIQPPVVIAVLMVGSRKLASGLHTYGFKYLFGSGLNHK